MRSYALGHMRSNAKERGGEKWEGKNGAGAALARENLFLVGCECLEGTVRVGYEWHDLYHFGVLKEDDDLDDLFNKLRYYFEQEKYEFRQLFRNNTTWERAIRHSENKRRFEVALKQLEVDIRVLHVLACFLCTSFRVICGRSYYLGREVNHSKPSAVWIKAHEDHHRSLIPVSTCKAEVPVYFDVTKKLPLPARNSDRRVEILEQNNQSHPILLPLPLHVPVESLFPPIPFYPEDERELRVDKLPLDSDLPEEGIKRPVQQYKSRNRFPDYNSIRELTTARHLKPINCTSCGSVSFKMTIIHALQHFGLLEGIAPCFLMQQARLFVRKNPTLKWKIQDAQFLSDKDAIQYMLDCLDPTIFRPFYEAQLYIFHKLLRTAFLVYFPENKFKLYGFKHRFRLTQREQMMTNYQLYQEGKEDWVFPHAQFAAIDHPHVALIPLDDARLPERNPYAGRSDRHFPRPFDFSY